MDFADEPVHEIIDATTYTIGRHLLSGNGSVFTGEPYVPFARRFETYVVPVIFAIIFFVGATGNGTLVLIFIRERIMRNVPNTYIMSLAIGDLLLILTCVPFTSVVYTFESWPFGLYICKISEFSKDVSVGVSVFTLTALSAERYCAISNPIRQRTIMSAKPAAVAIWIAAVLLALPSVLLSIVDTEYASDNHPIYFCTPYPNKLGDKYRKGMVLLKFLLYYAVPLCIIACFYILMARHLEMTTRNIPGELQGSNGQIKARKKVAKMVLSIVIMFMICFLPHHIFMLWFHFHPNSQDDFDEFWNVFRITAFCLSFTNSCINPIMLYSISGVYRKYFKHYLFGCCCRRDAHQLMNSENTSARANSLSCRRHNSVMTHQITLTNTDNS